MRGTRTFSVAELARNVTLHQAKTRRASPKLGSPLISIGSEVSNQDREWHRIGTTCP
jgi:hypothetical protein